MWQPETTRSATVKGNYVILQVTISRMRSSYIRTITLTWTLLKRYWNWNLLLIIALLLLIHQFILFFRVLLLLLITEFNCGHFCMTKFCVAMLQIESCIWNASPHTYVIYVYYKLHHANEFRLHKNLNMHIYAHIDTLSNIKKIKI